MSEDLNEAISLEQAVERMMAPETEPDASDETPEIEEAEGIAESDEPEVDEPEGEQDDEGDPEEEPSIELELSDGKKRKLTASEVAEGVMLKADYTRKTMALADERRQVEAAQSEIAGRMKQLEEALQVWAVPTEQEPNWAQLAAQMPPQEFNKARVQWEQRQRQAQAAREQFQALRAEQFQEQRRAEQERLFEAVPEWRDPAKFKAAATQIIDTGNKYGFSQEELAGVIDHRMLLVLRDAAAYRALQEGKPAVAKKVPAAPATLKPGPKPATGTDQKAARQKQHAKLKQSGRLDDAIALLFR